MFMETKPSQGRTRQGNTRTHTGITVETSGLTNVPTSIDPGESLVMQPTPYTAPSSLTQDFPRTGLSPNSPRVPQSGPFGQRNNLQHAMEQSHNNHTHPSQGQTVNERPLSNQQRLNTPQGQRQIRVYNDTDASHSSNNSQQADPIRLACDTAHPVTPRQNGQQRQRSAILQKLSFQQRSPGVNTSYEEWIHPDSYAAQPQYFVQSAGSATLPIFQLNLFDPYHSRATVLGDGYGIPSLKYLGDALQPLLWKHGEEPLDYGRIAQDHRMWQGIFDGVLHYGQQLLQARSSPQHFEQASYIQKLIHCQLIYFIDVVKHERIQIYNAFTAARRHETMNYTMLKRPDNGPMPPDCSESLHEISVPERGDKSQEAYVKELEMIVKQANNKITRLSSEADKQANTIQKMAMQMQQMSLTSATKSTPLKLTSEKAKRSVAASRRSTAPNTATTQTMTPEASPMSIDDNEGTSKPERSHSPPTVIIHTHKLKEKLAKGNSQAKDKTLFDNEDDNDDTGLSDISRQDEDDEGEEDEHDESNEVALDLPPGFQTGRNWYLKGGTPALDALAPLPSITRFDASIMAQTGTKMTNVDAAFIRGGQAALANAINDQLAQSARKRAADPTGIEEQAPRAKAPKQRKGRLPPPKREDGAALTDEAAKALAKSAGIPIYRKDANGNLTRIQEGKKPGGE